MMIIGGIDLQKKKKMKGKYRWSFFKQPGAVVEYTKEDLPENPEANGFVMSANKWWMTNPNAENKKIYRLVTMNKLYSKKI